jgi:hypothetical protein
MREHDEEYSDSPHALDVWPIGTVVGSGSCFIAGSEKELSFRKSASD